MILDLDSYNLKVLKILLNYKETIIVNLFDEVMKNTQVILNPKNLISTYNQTKVRYHIVTEPSYNQNSIKNSE